MSHDTTQSNLSNEVEDAVAQIHGCMYAIETWQKVILEAVAITIQYVAIPNVGMLSVAVLEEAKRVLLRSGYEVTYQLNFHNRSGAVELIARVVVARYDEHGKERLTARQLMGLFQGWQRQLWAPQ